MSRLLVDEAPRRVRASAWGSVPRADVATAASTLPLALALALALTISSRAEAVSIVMIDTDQIRTIDAGQLPFGGIDTIGGRPVQATLLPSGIASFGCSAI